jgi:3-phenylpropionate/cinnamic acid dioxygenase small subunit
MSDSSLAISNLIACYAELIDAGDFEGVANLLDHAAVGSGDDQGLLTGRDAFLSMFTKTTRLYPDGTPRTKHVTTNLILHVDDDVGTATARTYWTVLQAVDGLPLQPILAGRYHDKFARVENVWRFAERRYWIDLVGDVSQHMLSHIPT